MSTSNILEEFNITTHYCVLLPCTSTWKSISS